MDQHMNATLDAAAADPHQTIAELRRQLDECRTELAARNSEYGERIAHQAASNEVLKVMSASPGDPQPVFDLITRRAWELCNANGAALYGFDGELIHLLSAHGTAWTSEREAAYRHEFPMAPTRGASFGRAILNRQIVHIRNFDADPEVAQYARDLGVRSAVSVPLLRNDTVIGAIALNAKESGGLSDGQVGLLETFAEQTVIAITSAETYRALQQRTGDLQESLEYQTATSDVLKVISRSTFDLQPVLDTVVETATRLCDAEQAVIFRRDGELLSLAANFGFPSDYEVYHKQRGPIRIDPDNNQSVAGRAVFEGRPVHIEDVAAVPGYPETAITLGKQRTSLGVPLLREGEPIGVIGLARQRVEPFTERQIELVTTFADQAVIAIENARLLTEIREALELQTATAEVLGVINSSPGDLVPVFDAMLEKALRLCEAAFGNMRSFDGERFHTLALRGVPGSIADLSREPLTPEPGSASARLVGGEPIVHIADITDTAAYRDGIPSRRLLADVAGARTALWVALRKDDALLGDFVIYRQEVQPFLDKQIALLENFAAQAVIAMENGRLLGELQQRTGDLQESLEYQTATSDVLRVISRSAFDLQPVLDTVCETAARLCGAEIVYSFRREGEAWRWAAGFGVPPEFAAHWQSLGAMPDEPESPSVGWRCIREARPAHIHDVAAVPGYPEAVTTLGKIRTALGVPLLREGEVIGNILLSRLRVEPFTDRQIELVQTFADQAVIP